MTAMWLFAAPCSTGWWFLHGSAFSWWPLYMSAVWPQHWWFFLCVYHVILFIQCDQPFLLWLCPFVAAAAAKSLQLCPTLCHPIGGSPPGSPIPGILQERMLEWVAISFSNAWKWKGKVKLLSRVWLFTTPRTASYQAPPFMGVSGQEYWSELPLPSLGNLPDPGIETTFLVSPALAG